jgi:membrane protein DedA with SNARE-associated domain
MIETFLSYGPNLTYFGIVFFLVLTGAGLPVPEEVPIVAAGVLSSGPDPFLNVYFAFAACLIGALLGDLLVYSIGRFLGTSFFRRHPHFAHLLHEEREKQMEDVIRKHGLKIFLVARFMVGVRAPLYLAAGVLRVSWRRFLIVDAFCATLVVSVVFWLSYRYGRVIGNLLRQSQITLTIIVLVIAAGVLVAYLIHRRRSAGTTSEMASPDGRALGEPKEPRSTPSRNVA